jgi:hypothetical protein
MFLLAYVFAASWFVTGATAAHLPALLELAFLDSNLYDPME